MATNETQETLESSSKATRDTIGKRTTIRDLLKCLTSRGCPDLTNIFLDSNLGEFPIASGGFGDIFTATLDSGEEVGLKCLRLQPDTDENAEPQAQLKRAAHELYVWSKCKHPNILPLIGVAEFRDRLAMVSPWMENGNLWQFLATKPDIDRYQMCIEIAEGVSFLHSVGLVHGDIKALNILVSKEHRPLLTDFGSASLREYTLKFSTTTYVAGTSLRWTAPEILLESIPGCGLSCGSDVYALGMTCLEVITGMVPYAGIGDFAVIRRVQASVPPDRPLACPNWFWLLITSCWVDVANRPTSADVRSRMKAHLFCNRLKPTVHSTGDLTSPGRSVHQSFETISIQDNRTRGLRAQGRVTLRETLYSFYRSKCLDLTRQIDMLNLPEYPVVSGTRNNVFRAKLTTGTIVAIKFQKGAYTPEEPHRRKQKLDIWINCNHRNILKVTGIAKCPYGIAIVTPWMEYKTLEIFLSQHSGGNQYELGAEIARGVAYLHKKRIVHGCIEAVGSNDASTMEKTLDIRNGSLGTLCVHMFSNILVSGDRVPKITGFDNAKHTYGLPVTPCPFDIDIFGLAMTILEMFTGGLDYLGPKETPLQQRMLQLKQNPPKRPQQMSHLTPEGGRLWNLLEICWSENLTGDPIVTSDIIYDELDLINKAHQINHTDERNEGQGAHPARKAWLDLSATLDDDQYQFNTEESNDPSIMISDIVKKLIKLRCIDVTGSIDLEASKYPNPQGTGGFGYIYNGVFCNGDLVGIKCPKLQFSSPTDRKKKLMTTAHEAHIWSRCNHPNVLDLIGVATYRDRLAMVSPWMGNGDLVTYMSCRVGRVNSINLCTHIASGITYLHKEEIIHGDIKGTNIVVSSDGIPKIIDFGSAISSRYSDFQPQSQYNRRHARSLRWTAPERLIPMSQPTCQADVYALAMTFLEVITGAVPYANTTEDSVVVRKIASGVYPEFPQLTPESRQDADNMLPLLRNCWGRGNRPEASHVLRELETMRTLVAQRATHLVDSIEKSRDA